jgi:transcriptional regulator with XRE-family HTH domain
VIISHCEMNGGDSVRKYLKELREERKMTQQAIADYLGISQNYYANIENGERQKSLDLVYVSKLAELFNVSVDWIAKQEQKVKTK